jgi:hypothetical protein
MVGDGTHEQLLAGCLTYQALVREQIGPAMPGALGLAA